jgi:hypothetical protein
MFPGPSAFVLARQLSQSLTVDQAPLRRVRLGTDGLGPEGSGGKRRGVFGKERRGVNWGKLVIYMVI